MTNAPAPVRQTSGESLLRVVTDSLRRVERNTNDPRPWIYVSEAPEWDGGTSYATGDEVTDTLTVGGVVLPVGYTALQANSGHQPGVGDPSVWTQYWLFTGPGFQNGFANAGGTYVPARYRTLRDYDPAALQESLELQGSVSGGSLGLTMFTLMFPRWTPAGYPDWVVPTLDFDLHPAATDSGGGFVPYTVQQSGDVVYGFV